MATDQETDQQLRLAAFNAVRARSEMRRELSGQDLLEGFAYQGERIPMINIRRGIFKPRQMKYLLSIKTVVPAPGRRIWYDDQVHVHRQIYAGDGAVDYAFMGDNPNAAENRWLRGAMEARIPVIYFLGVAPGLYQAIVPSYVIGWDERALKARIAFGMPAQDALEFPASEKERRYALREVKHRLHQASFREAVIAAYDSRCAITRLPEPRLLDAAHIIADRDEQFGQPVIPNGIPLSKIHHAAFDAHLIGIDRDFRVHVSNRLLTQNDGPMLEALKKLHRIELHLPARKKDWPDRDRLAVRFDEFRGYE
jgi:putative restriction endonuclease